MQPVAVGVEMILGEIFVPCDVIFSTELFGLDPGF